MFIYMGPLTQIIIRLIRFADTMNAVTGIDNTTRASFCAFF